MADSGKPDSPVATGIPGYGHGPRYQQLVAEQFTPLRITYGEHQAEMAHLPDRRHGHKAFSRPQKKKIAHLVRDICIELINTLEREDLKPLYNKYSETDFDARDQEVSALAPDPARA